MFVVSRVPTLGTVVVVCFAGLAAACGGEEASAPDRDDIGIGDVEEAQDTDVLDAERGDADAQGQDVPAEDPCLMPDALPEIVSLELEPRHILLADTTREEPVFVAIVTTRCFTSPLQTASVFVGAARHQAPGNVSFPSDGVVRIDAIPGTWLEGLAAGEYTVGASVTSESESLLEQELSQLKIEGE